MDQFNEDKSNFKKEQNTKINELGQKIKGKIQDLREKVENLIPKSNKMNEQSGEVQLEEEEKVIFDWAKSKFDLSTSFKQELLTSIEILIYFSIYGGISFVLFDDMELPINSTIKAITFPIFTYILISYRGFKEYGKAIVGMVFVLVLSIFLLTYDIITFEGVTIVNYTRTLMEWLNISGFTHYDLNDPYSVIELTTELLLGLFAIEFILLILHEIIKRNKNIQFKITNKSIYLKDRKKSSKWHIAKYVILIIFNPFHVKLYRDMIKIVKYNNMTSSEGKKMDLAEIDYRSIKKVEIKEIKNSKSITVFLVLLIVSFAGIFILNILILPISLISLFMLINAIFGRNKFDISISFKRSEVKGSWKYTNTATKIVLRRLNRKYAEFFNSKFPQNQDF